LNGVVALKQMAQTRRVFGDAIISIAGLAALVLLLATFDERVREQISLRVGMGGASQIADAEATVRSLTLTLVDAVRDQSLEHSPLVIFVLAAVVLTLVMLRT
jgi:hypothetical protein